MINEMQNKLAMRRAKVDKETGVDTEEETSSLPPPVPLSCFENQWTAPNNAVAVDKERKEELILAKQVRQGSVKFISRRSESPYGPQCPPAPSVAPSQASPVTLKLAPPSPIVQRYWSQCQGNSTSSEDFSAIEDQATGI